MLAVFDGHNDALGRMQVEGTPPDRFLLGLPERHLDLPRARAGGLGGGLFAVHAPSPPGEVVQGDGSWAVTPAGPLDPERAATFTLGGVGRAHALAAESSGTVRVVRSAAELAACRREGVLAVVLHLEGAEAVGPDLLALDAWVAAGVRSLGLVWSRPNAFGRGVPFRFPSNPDTGPGLTPAGRRLVRRCAELGLAVDLSHLNAAGFADVARIGAGPLIASHSGCHALCPSSRNLTDAQLREIAASGGLVGVIFEPASLRRDGVDDPDTPLSAVVAHVLHVAEVAGPEHVALGSDFDGARMPWSLRDPTGLPDLLAELRAAGFAPREVEAIAWGNWDRVLAAAWG